MRCPPMCLLVLLIGSSFCISGCSSVGSGDRHELDRRRELDREVARRGLTLVRDAAGLVPLARGTKVFVLDVFEAERADSGRAWRSELALAGIEVVSRVLHAKSASAKIELALAEARTASMLLVGLHSEVRTSAGQAGLPVTLQAVVEVLRSHRRAIVVAFGDPYLMREFPQIGTYLCTFDQGPVIESVVAAALTGGAPITGRLPIPIPDVAAMGAGLSRFSGLADSGLADPGLANDLPERIRELLAAQVAKRTFPGAVAMVTRRGRLLAKVAVGRETYSAEAPEVTMATLYDLASLTKVCATLPALAVLLDRGVVALDDRLDKWVPEFRGAGKDAVTIRHAMVHSSGLPAFVRFYRQGKVGKRAIVKAAARTDLIYRPGTKKVYSDLGLILLMAVVEQACGQTLDRFLAAEVYGPLGVKARFGHPGQPLNAAPTEEDPWRGRLVRGEVHDENAFAMGGVSGHAGLFGTAEDVARIGNLFLGGGGDLIRGSLARQLTRRDDMVAGSTRALLFDTFKKGGSGGHRLSARAFGHTGFTGTSLWCDPRTDLCMVLLTNRVHPSRKNRRIAAARRSFHDLVMACLESAR